MDRLGLLGNDGSGRGDNAEEMELEELEMIAEEMFEGAAER